MTTKDYNGLVRAMKEIVEADAGNGITSSDVRRALAQWIHDNGQQTMAQKFQDEVLAYELSPKVQEMVNIRNGRED